MEPYHGPAFPFQPGKLEIEVPRDRQSSFDPQLIAKYQRRFPGFDDKIVLMYARGMSTREIAGHLRDLYGIDVSPDLISTVTDAVLDEVATWQQRPLDPVYPLVFFDAIRVKIRDEGMVRNKAIHIALGVRADGAKEILGLWLEQNEGAKFWLRVMNELKNRGTGDILLAVVDGLKGFPEAITAVFPETVVQTCSSICCATRWTLSPGRTARGWRKRSSKFTAPPMPRPPKRRWWPSMPVPGASAIPSLARAGGAPGVTSSRSSPSPTRSAGSSTPPTP
jgi:hypothetical protein